MQNQVRWSFIRPADAMTRRSLFTERLSAAHPENKGALKDLLTALWMGDHYEEAADVGARLTQLSKNDVDAEFIYARSLLAIGQKEEALAALQRCRELDPEEQHIQLAAARVESMLRDYDSALVHLTWKT